MELIQTDDIAAAPSEFHRPRILTLDLVGRLADINAAARQLRRMGLRVMEEDTVPDDGGRPILLLALNGVSIEQVRNQCEASTLHVKADLVTGMFQGVRIMVRSDA